MLDGAALLFGCFFGSAHEVVQLAVSLVSFFPFYEDFLSGGDWDHLLVDW